MTPAQQEEHRFLVAQVDKLQDELFHKDRGSRTQQRLFHAREDLRKFVSDLRKNGINI